MSLLYKKESEQKLEVEFMHVGNNVFIDFSKDCGKHGAHEPIDGYKLTPSRILEILQDRDNYTDDEI